jgi:hypothetical protein
MTDQHVAVSGGRTFEDLLADPHEQFDVRSELLASIFAYASAPPASAGTQPWQPAPAPGARYAWLYSPASTTGATAA